MPVKVCDDSELPNAVGASALLVTPGGLALQDIAQRVGSAVGCLGEGFLGNTSLRSRLSHKVATRSKFGWSVVTELFRFAAFLREAHIVCRVSVQVTNKCLRATHSVSRILCW